MTCIVGLVHENQVWMGSDSAGVDGAYNLTIMRQPKVFKNGQYLLGYTTSFRMGQLLQHVLQPPELPSDEDLFGFMVSKFTETVRKCFLDGGFSKVDSNRHTGGTFLVGARGRLFRIEDDFQVQESTRLYEACGCGAQYAMGAMWAMCDHQPLLRIKRALSASNEFSAGVCGPWHVESI